MIKLLSVSIILQWQLPWRGGRKDSCNCTRKKWADQWPRSQRQWPWEWGRFCNLHSPAQAKRPATNPGLGQQQVSHLKSGQETDLHCNNTRALHGVWPPYLEMESFECRCMSALEWFIYRLIVISLKHWGSDKLATWAFWQTEVFSMSQLHLYITNCSAIGFQLLLHPLNQEQTDSALNKIAGRTPILAWHLEAWRGLISMHA